jgi:hypothetical protein
MKPGRTDWAPYLDIVETYTISIAGLVAKIFKTGSVVSARPVPAMLPVHSASSVSLSMQQ